MGWPFGGASMWHTYIRMMIALSDSNHWIDHLVKQAHACVLGRTRKPDEVIRSTIQINKRRTEPYF